jgi:hypothetical protein
MVEETQQRVVDLRTETRNGPAIDAPSKPVEALIGARAVETVREALRRADLRPTEARLNYALSLTAGALGGFASRQAQAVEDTTPLQRRLTRYDPFVSDVRSGVLISSPFMHVQSELMETLRSVPDDRIIDLTVTIDGTKVEVGTVAAGRPEPSESPSRWRAGAVAGALLLGGVLGGCATDDPLADIDAEQTDTACDESVGLPSSQVELARQRVTALTSSLAEQPIQQMTIGEPQACLYMKGDDGTAAVRVPISVGQRTINAVVPYDLVDADDETDRYVEKAREGLAELGDRLRVEPTLDGQTVQIGIDDTGTFPFFIFIPLWLVLLMNRVLLSGSSRRR